MSSPRATWLHVTEMAVLHDWAVGVRVMFRGQVPHLVGSALRTRQWRDVDVRVILGHDEHKALDALMSIARLNVAVSMWGQRSTGLPIDFQVQRIDVANAEPGARHPLGLLRDVEPRSVVDVDED